MNWENYQFRCSKLGQLMTEPREKSPLVKHGEALEKLADYKKKYAETKNKETKAAQAILENIATQEENVRVLAEVKDLPYLSETVKTYLQEIYIQEVYGREKDIMNRYMAKGLMKEEDSISLLTQTTGTFFVKNDKHLENEYIKGTPDIIGPKFIIDVKTSWDIWSFAKADLTKDYEWQLRGYMWLTGKQKSLLYYCLVDAPEVMVEDELRRLNWKMFMIDDQDPFYIEAAEKVQKNMMFSDIPPLKRIKSFQVDADYEKIEALKARIRECRVYLSQMDL